MSTHSEIYRRHLAERPVRGLTDDELHVLIKLGSHLGLFAPELVEHLGVLHELAAMEDSERYSDEQAREVEREAEAAPVVEPLAVRDEPLLDELVKWIEARGSKESWRVRLTGQGRTHTGSFSVQRTSRGASGERVVVRVRDASRGARTQYQSVFERYLHGRDDGSRRLELQVSSGRYVPWVELRMSSAAERGA